MGSSSMSIGSTMSPTVLAIEPCVFLGGAGVFGSSGTLLSTMRVSKHSSNQIKTDTDCLGQIL